MYTLFQPVALRSAAVACAMFALPAAAFPQSQSQTKAEAQEAAKARAAAAEERAEKIAAEVEAWAEKFSAKMEQDGEALGRSIEEAVLRSLGEADGLTGLKGLKGLGALKGLGELRGMDGTQLELGNLGDLEGWAERYAAEWEAWGDAQEHLWEGWAERHESGWENFAKQLEGLDPESEEFGKLLSKGLAENLSSLQELPLHGLGAMPAIPGLGVGSPLDAEALGELIRDSIEGSLQGLEGLEGLGALRGIEIDGAAEADVRAQIERSLSAVREATQGLRSGVRSHRGALREDSEAQWKVLEEALEGLHTDEENGRGVIELRLPRGRKGIDEALSKKIEARVRERLELLRSQRDGEQRLVEQLKEERATIDGRSQELEDLRKQVDALRAEVDRLRKDSQRRSGQGAML